MKRVSISLAVLLALLSGAHAHVRNAVTPQSHQSIHGLGVVGFSSADCPAESCTVDKLICAESTKLFVCDGAGTWTTGDVAGPASSTDQMIARHDGVAGKSLGPDYTPSDPSLAPIVSDAGVVIANGGLVSVDSFSANRDLRMADPTTGPTPTDLAPGASCSNANTYRFFMSLINETGETLSSPASTPDFTPGDAGQLLTITAPSFDPRATQWHAWYSSSADGFTAVLGCGQGGAVVNAIAGSTTVCLCASGGSEDNPPVANTTDITPVFVVDGVDGIQRPRFQVVEVCADDCAYKTVQAGIDAAELISIAGVDSIVLIGPGTYNEFLTLGRDAIDEDIGSITLQGRSRDSVIITGTTTGDMLAISWGKNEIRDLTILHDGATGSAIQYLINDAQPVNVGHPDSRITNVRVSCTNQTTIFNHGCIHYETRLQTTFLSNLTIRDSLIEFNLAGLNIHDPGHIYTSGNVIRRIRTLTDGPASIQAVQVNRFIGGTSSLWLSTGDAIEVTRVNTADAISEIEAIAFVGSTSDHVIFNGLSILMEIRGTSTAGYVAGIVQKNTGSTARAVCIGCDVRVSRPNVVSGDVYAVFHNGLGTSPINIIGGFYEATNLVGDTGTEFFNNGGVLNVDARLKRGSHRLTPLAAAPATCSIGDTYADTSGAFCACTATDTWSNMTATGTCV